jgi:non-heme chloroperoxidase
MPATTDLPVPTAVHEVLGGGGVRLHVREWGAADGPPIVFVHGWSQAQLCWARQTGGALARDFRLVTFDLRGHGMSERPAGADGFADARVWAEDLRGVIDALGLVRPVLVAWSYGGFVVGDYLRAFGEDAVAGIELVGGAVVLREDFAHIGPGFLENAGEACSADLPTSIAAVRRFLGRCTARPLSDEDRSSALCWTMVVPPDVRGALLARAIDNDDVWSRLHVPVLVTHGRADEIVLPSMAEHVLRVCPSARASWYDGVGHMPFVEAQDRFDRELAAFAIEAGAGVSSAAR